MIKSVKNLNKFEICLWIVSVVVVTLSFLLAVEKDYMTLTASLIGVTALIFMAKGDVLGQLFSALFAVFYAVVSYKFRYFGEMITYLGMTAPSALIAVITWIRNPYAEKQVRVSRVTGKKVFWILVLSIPVTFIFYFILKFFGTSNLLVSTLSVTTSFLASMLSIFRSPYYAVAYALNDVVLIILWILASIADISFLPMIFCFLMFLINDLYAYFNWLKIEKEQSI